MIPRAEARVPNPPGHLLHEVDALKVGTITKWRARCIVDGCTVRGTWCATLGAALAQLHAHEDDAECTSAA